MKAVGSAGRRSIGRMRGAAVMMIAALLVFFLPAEDVTAYDVVDSISITVGYWGDQSYTKKEVSLSELAKACGTHQEIYTWISNGDKPGTTEAEGVYLADAIDYCGVDLGSVYYYNFYTTDGGTYSSSNQQWTTSQLLGTRYTYRSCFETAVSDFAEDNEDYLRNPESHYTIEDIYDFSAKKYTQEAWNNREVVEPMLALKTKSNSWKGFTPASKLDFSGMDSNGRPILVFGQAGRNDITRNLMAQMVTQIHIWFEGSPSIVLKSDDLEGEAGDEKGYELTVTTPDEYLTEKILENIEIKSSDDSIVKVDQNGHVTIEGEGTAEITASYNGQVYSSLTVTGKAKEPEEDPEDNGSGSGTGTSEGDGSGSSSGANNGSGKGTGRSGSKSSGSGSNDQSSKSANRTAGGSQARRSLTAKKPQSKSVGSATQKTSGTTAQGSTGGAASGSGNSNVKVYEISAADDVYMERSVSRSLARGVWITALIAIGVGIVIEGRYYRGQLHWADKARRIYEKL